MNEAAPDWPPQRGDATEAIRRHDWRSSPLGPLECWPGSLRSAVELVASLPAPAAVLWGDALVLIPNDAFVRMSDGEWARPGVRAAEAWPEAWHAGPDLFQCVRAGDPRSVVGGPAASRATFCPLRDETGSVAGAVVTMSGHRAASQRRMDDLRHQSRNALAWVRSVVRRTAAVSSDIEDFLAHFDGRIDAFSRVRTAALIHPGGVPLYDLAASELLAVGAQEDGRLQFDGPEVQLAPRAAECLALAVHELATNAVKFGALTCPDGNIAVSWRILPGSSPRLVFEWAESGLAEAPVIERRGFGFEVLEQTLPYDLAARTEISARADGLHVVIEMDLARVTMDA